MVTKFVTYFEPLHTLEGKLGSEVELAVWNFDEETREFSSAGKTVTKIRQIIPTPLLLGSGFYFASNALNDYKESVKDKYAEVLEDIEKKISILSKKKKISEDLEKLMSKKEAISAFLDNIDSEIELQGPFKAGDGERYEVYHIVTPPLGEKLLKKFQNSIHKYRFTGEIKHTAQISAHLGFPFEIMSNNEDETSLPERVKTEDLLSAKRVSFDIETHNYEHVVFHDDGSFSSNELREKLQVLSAESGIKLKRKLNKDNRKEVLLELDRLLNIIRNEIVTTAVISDVSSEDNYLVTIFPSKIDYIDVKIPGKEEEKRFKIITASSQEDFGAKINEVIRKIDPLYIMGNYQITFDYRKVQKLTGNMDVGTISGKPKFRGQMLASGRNKHPKPKKEKNQTKAYIQQYINKGIIDIDNSLYSRATEKIQRNNKLDTIMNSILGVLSKKTLNYAELKEETNKALQGAQESINEILYYTAQDGMKSNMTGNHFLEEHILLAKAFGSLPSRIDATSKGTIAENYWSSRFFRKNKTHHFFNVQLLEFFLPPPKGEIETYSFEDFHPQELIEELFPLKKTRKGLVSGYLVELFPLAKAFEPLLSKDSCIKELYDFVRKTDNADVGKKARVLRMIEALGKYPLAVLYSSLKKTQSRYAYIEERKEFLEDQKEFYEKDYKEKLEGILKNISFIYKNNLVINHHNETILLSDETPSDVLESLKKFGVIRGEGTFLSGETGRVAGNINDELVLLGIADYDSNRGERCKFEKKFIEQFLTRLLINKDEKSAIEYAVGQAELFNNEEINQDLLVFEAEAKTDYSRRRHKAGDKEKETPEYFFIESKARKGEKIKYVHSKAYLWKKFFGVTFTEPVSKASRKYENTLFKEEFKPGIEARLSSDGGTLGTLVSWLVNPENTSEGKEKLLDMYIKNKTN
ncbi:MAG: hypothetical protein ACP5N3_00095 [Candidatus Nanoarchaeia archaeon]